ncbi:hypothetical protein BUALT_Bualt10G0135200 [Buddleja alternifolia]|uniref:DUF1677 domain-containing protein n=1 Tax=Buddleja alternifolia TaxID=168488 RepID=A0AAV6X9G2_9LAMI|nr:hypothetical protein BUALT_Bualt10G0135200 [Buddleja alternifolia]
MYMIFKRLIIGGEIVEEEVLMEIAKQTPAAKGTEIAFARCECCGLTEECTEEYIKRVRDRYSGRWICGLCSEAVKDEIVRSDKGIGNEEALNQHMSFCKKFKNLMSPPKNPTEELISAVKQLLLRSLDSPRSSPTTKRGLVRSQSCRPALGSGRA